jgi:phosphohistidine swiveling domain-containing protein
MLLKKLEIESKKYHLIKQESPASLLLCISMWNDGYLGKKYFKYNKADNGSLFWVVGEGHCIIALRYNPYKKFCKDGMKKYFLTNKKLRNIVDFEKYSKKTEKIYSENHPEKIKKYSDLKIKKTLLKINDLAVLLAACTVFCEPLDESLLKEEYVKLIGSENGFEEFFSVSTALVFDSLKARREKIILLKTKNGATKIDPYYLQWVDTYYYSSKTIQETKAKLSSLNFKSLFKEITKNDSIVSKNKKMQNKYLKKSKKEIKKLIKFTTLCMHLRDFRRDYFSMCGTVMFNLAYEYFKRKGFTPNDCVHSYYTDYKSGFVDSKKYLNEIEKRKKGMIMYVESGSLKTKIEFGEYQTLRKKVLGNIYGSEMCSIVKGTVACKGFITGKVCVVSGINEFNKFKSGEILVTSMTRPEFVPIMKKAKAIITDEGGITCHAAIVSRELNIPCIIGTNNATRILKDGDFVEVDAEKGIIKILET